MTRNKLKRPAPDQVIQKDSPDDYTGPKLAEKLAAIGIQETERNLNNKISRGGFTTAFLIQCLEAIGCRSLQLSDG